MRALLLVSSLLALQALVPASPDAILQRMRARQAALESLRARLEETKSYPQLGIEDPPERGRFYWKRGKKGSRLRIEIETPERRVLTIRNGRYLLYQPRVRQVIEGDVAGVGSRGVFSGVLTASPDAMAELERSYSVESLGETSLEGRRVHGLRFTVLPGSDVYCRKFDLFVDASLFLPVRQTCEESNQSLTTFSLSGIETDVALEEKLFEIEIPPGTERLKR